MTTVKLVGKPSASASEAIARHAPGSTRIGVIVLKRRFVTSPDPGEETEPTVHLGIAGLEIASPEQEEHLRNALTVLKLHRNADGTLFDDTEGIVGIEPARAPSRPSPASSTGPRPHAYASGWRTGPTRPAGSCTPPTSTSSRPATSWTTWPPGWRRCYCSASRCSRDPR